MSVTSVSEAIRKGIGWCPMTPATSTALTMITNSCDTETNREPGGAGRSGQIDRGIRFTVGSFKILNENRQLLWFSFLTGLVMLFVFCAAFVLHVFGMYPYPPMEYPVRLALIFSILTIALFSLNSLVAGLMASVFPILSGRNGSIRETLSGVRRCLKTIALLSVVPALLGTACYYALTQYFGNYDIGIYHFWNYDLAIYQLVNQFPFSFILLPEYYNYGPIGGSFNIPSAVSFTVFAAIFIGVFFILTLFVIPASVMEHKRLPDAARESVSRIRKARGEIMVSFLIFGLAFLAISLAALLFRVAYGIVSPDNLLFWRPAAGWIAGAVVYMIAWFILVVIGTTMAGISLAGLYCYAKTGQIPARFLTGEGNRQAGNKSRTRKGQ